MNNISLMKNTVQEYAWGSLTAIAELLGNGSPSKTPQAELWMGAHPKAPSMVTCDGNWISLLEFQ
jgi:mannose-6-phosphate isomerase